MESGLCGCKPYARSVRAAACGGRGRKTVYNCKLHSCLGAAQRSSSQDRWRGRVPGARCSSSLRRGQQPVLEGPRPAPPPRGASWRDAGDRGRDRHRELGPSALHFSASLFPSDCPCALNAGRPAGVEPQPQGVNMQTEYRKANLTEPLLRGQGTRRSFCTLFCIQDVDRKSSRCTKHPSLFQPRVGARSGAQGRDGDNHT